MALDAKIIINMTKPVGNVGFGCPLILEENDYHPNRSRI